MGNIIFFGRNPAIMALVKQQIMADGHRAEGFLEEEEMTSRLRNGPVSLLVLGAGVETAARDRCRALCAELGLSLVEHDGGSDALSRNIHAALSR